ncbi:fumarylacetoacetate hydrolase family protein [Gluconacetobacter diazotrophicus]|uniref:Putative fumarylacetoacetate (FAA) hydrolase protein n=1 Tax=Gluconacetobacter diazotrophicus (strain ATCC 49037 / DSM 5601 / CCUG 37298 / CIP 103539 / LMG 7603 / PAl5) TaxID=272568 RepID=A9HCF1_GLUDA|nr:fumarylacetoacetate hydrolase family protein [Gluconacetobacter diazotrophicus]CAP54938.1 putative fumarylacetoacetate (FAA) hydrolase protein [Gluconacetobacter diazotrophicus PA1 5]
MKLCRYGEPGEERPALIDQTGGLRSLAGVVGDVSPEVLAPARLAALAAIDPSSLPQVDPGQRLGVPVAGIGKYICIGLNYRDHAEEAGLPVPDEPIIFLKAITALSGPDDPIIPPIGATQLDWEAELAVIIGTRAKNIAVSEALDHVAGYCVANDVSERAFQMQSSQWDKGKGCDTFGPLGPWLVSRDEVPDPQNLAIWLDVNGRRMQCGTTRTMVFSVAEIVAYVSRYMTLMPGDVIATGTPPGVGMGMRPEPVYLRSGDVVELGIEGLGRQRQCVA